MTSGIDVIPLCWNKRARGCWCDVFNLKILSNAYWEAPSRVLGGWLGPGERLTTEDGSVLDSDMLNALDRRV